MKNKAPSLSILVAEDNTIVRDVLMGMLQRMGYAADQVGNGADALEAVKSNNYDLLFMDLKMPVMNGIEATMRIQKEVNPGQRPVIIAISNYSRELQQGLSAGMRGFINKPVSYEQLLRTLSVFSPELDTESKPEVEAPQRRYTDLKALYEMTGGNIEFSNNILNKIITRLPDDFDWMRDCLDKEDWDGLRKAAHKAKSSCGYAGAAPLLELLREMEFGAESDLSLEEVKKIFGRAEVYAGLVLNELEEEVRAREGSM